MAALEAALDAGPLAVARVQKLVARRFGWNVQCRRSDTCCAATAGLLRSARHAIERDDGAVEAESRDLAVDEGRRRPFGY